MSAWIQRTAHDAAIDPERVRGALKAVLARPEFLPPQRTWRDWVADRMKELGDWISDVLGLSSRSTVTLVLYVLGVLALGWIVWLVVRHWPWRARRAADEPAPSPAQLRAARAAELLARARAARAAGDLAAALRHSFAALVIGLSEQGRLEYRDTWTYRELLERGAPRADVRGALHPLVPRLDAVSFGHAPAAIEEVDALDALCRLWLGKAAT